MLHSPDTPEKQKLLRGHTSSSVMSSMFRGEGISFSKNAAFVFVPFNDFFVQFLVSIVVTFDLFFELSKITSALLRIESRQNCWPDVSKKSNGKSNSAKFHHCPVTSDSDFFIHKYIRLQDNH